MIPIIKTNKSQFVSSICIIIQVNGAQTKDLDKEDQNKCKQYNGLNPCIIKRVPEFFTFFKKTGHLSTNKNSSLLR